MEIKLKKIRYYKAMSEETCAFLADVYVSGKNVGYAKNDGKGGCTNYAPYPMKTSKLIQIDNRAMLRLAEQYCETLPSIKLGDYELKMSLSEKIDQLFQEWFIAKNKKRF